MSGWVIYALLLPPCFFIVYWKGAIRQNRFLIPGGYGFFRYHATLFFQGVVLLWYDHFLLHCPLSWEVAKKYRVQWVRDDIGPHGKVNMHLGFITQAECDDPRRHEQIAQLCFHGRGMFWLKSTIHCVFSPIILSITAVMAAMDYFDPPKSKSF